MVRRGTPAALGTAATRSAQTWHRYMTCWRDVLAGVVADTRQGDRGDALNSADLVAGDQEPRVGRRTMFCGSGAGRGGPLVVQPCRLGECWHAFRADGRGLDLRRVRRR